MHFKKMKVGHKGHKVKGKGRDEIGEFKISGEVDQITGDIGFKK